MMMRMLLLMDVVSIWGELRRMTDHWDEPMAPRYLSPAINTTFARRNRHGTGMRKVPRIGGDVVRIRHGLVLGSIYRLRMMRMMMRMMRMMMRMRMRIMKRQVLRRNGHRNGDKSGIAIRVVVVMVAFYTANRNGMMRVNEISWIVDDNVRRGKAVGKRRIVRWMTIVIIYPGVNIAAKDDHSVIF